jgi:hypothetical protein
MTAVLENHIMMQQPPNYARRTPSFEYSDSGGTSNSSAEEEDYDPRSSPASSSDFCYDLSRHDEVLMLVNPLSEDETVPRRGWSHEAKRERGGWRNEEKAAVSLFRVLGKQLRRRQQLRTRKEYNYSYGDGRGSSFLSPLLSTLWISWDWKWE